VRVLLDENLPDSLVRALRTLGHAVDSVNSLGLKGASDSTLIRDAFPHYDLVFTRDTALVRRAGLTGRDTPCKVLRVTLQQAKAHEFTTAFVGAFQPTRWESYNNGDDWP
jgi:predicted nuclease of predicted toxin-antitoxin system